MPSTFHNPLDQYGGSFARWFEDWAQTHILVPKGHAICEQCNGIGTTGGTADRYTDPVVGGGEEQWRGYLPTNFCAVCDGTGIWPPMKEAAR
jgi:hypothetical protein